MAEEDCVRQTHEVKLGKRMVTVEEWVPNLEPQKRDAQMAAIERGLYDIFIHYEEKAAGPRSQHN